MRINQPVGFFLLLWPTLWGLWISNQGMPDLFILMIFIIGTVCMRSAGCIINDCIDYKIDIYVKRTKRRPIPSGLVNMREALLICFMLISISAGLVCIFNVITVFLSFISLILSIIYPYLKRYIYFPQLILGVLFSWPILITHTAIGCVINNVTWLLFMANVTWVISYDTVYAMIDRDDDRRIGVKSSALLFGNMDIYIIGMLQGITVFLLSIIGYLEELSMIFYYFSVFGVSILFLWQQILIRNRKKIRCFQAFLNNSCVGMLIFIGIVLSYF